MLDNLRRAIRIRAAAVLVVVHLGLLLSLYSMYSHQRGLLIAGIAGLYGGIVLAVFFVVRLASPFVQAVRPMEQLPQDFHPDLPAVLKTVPKALVTLEGFKAAWNAGKRAAEEKRRKAG